MKKVFDVSMYIWGILFLLSVLLSLVPLFLGAEGAQRRIQENYFSLPLFLFLALLLFVLAAALFFMAARKEKGEQEGWKRRLAMGSCGLLMAGFGVLAFVVQVVNPLRDIPYLKQPDAVTLEKVSFHYDGTGDSPSISLEGTDPEGGERYFQIDHDIYEEGKTLWRKAYENDEGDVSVQIRYLPWSKTILGLEMWIDGEG